MLKKKTFFVIIEESESKSTRTDVFILKRREVSKWSCNSIVGGVRLPLLHCDWGYTQHPPGGRLHGLVGKCYFSQVIRFIFFFFIANFFSGSRGWQPIRADAAWRQFVTVSRQHIEPFTVTMTPAVNFDWNAERHLQVPGNLENDPLRELKLRRNRQNHVTSPFTVWPRIRFITVKIMWVINP